MLVHVAEAFCRRHWSKTHFLPAALIARQPQVLAAFRTNSHHMMPGIPAAAVSKAKSSSRSFGIRKPTQTELGACASAKVETSTVFWVPSERLYHNNTTTWGHLSMRSGNRSQWTK